MGAKAGGQKPIPQSRFKVGDRVNVRIVQQDYAGTIVEDRGLLAAGGRRLWRIKLDFDSPNVRYIELPEVEMKAAE
jgi:hypothetical protein